MKTTQATLFTCLCLIFSAALFGQTASSTQGCSPLEVGFTPPEGQSGFFWDFKDGATSTEQTPDHVFSNPGTYEVDFKNEANGAVIGTVTIEVFEKPELMPTASATIGCAPLAIDFSDGTTYNPNIEVSRLQWTFGDGNSANVPTPSYTYTNPGTYTISMAAETNFPSCNVTSIFEDFVTVANGPQVGIQTTPSIPVACIGPLTVSFRNTTQGGNNLSYLWDLGNGNTSTAFEPPMQTYTEDGTYTVTLSVTDNELGCTLTETVIVSVGTPEVAFNIPDTVCINEPINLMNASPVGIYLWSFDQGTSLDQSTDRDPTVSFTTPGVHTIDLSVTSLNGGCVGIGSVDVFVDQPNGAITATPAKSCTSPVEVAFSTNDNDIVAWDWTFNDGSTSTEANPTQIISNPDTTTYSINGAILDTTMLRVTSAGGCVAEEMYVFTLHQPNALFVPDTLSGCAPLEVTFKDSSYASTPLTTWQYDFGDGQTRTNNNANDFSYTYTQAGEYDVQLVVTNNEGCQDTSYTVTIEVGTPVAPDFSLDNTTVCPGETVNFSNFITDDRIDEWHITTDNGRSSHCADAPLQSWTFETETGAKDVTLITGYNGCYAELNLEDAVTVSGPIAEIGYYIDCETPFDVTFYNKSMEATSVSWNFGDGSDPSTALDSIIHTYENAGVYTVILTAENANTNCAPSTDTVMVNIQQIIADFTIPEQVCVGQNYSLDATDAQGVNAYCWKGFKWEFSDNRPITTQEIMTDYSWTAPGEQEVTLIATDINGCTDTLAKTLQVYQTIADFELDPTRICFPTEVNFTDNSSADTTIVSWAWDFGDGGMSEEQNPSYVFSTPTGEGQTGVIPVTLSIEDALGCPASKTFDLPYYRPFTTISPATANICEGSDIAFTATDFTQEGSSLTFDWDFGNGATSQTQNPTATFDESGTYNVQLNIEEIATGCRESFEVPINVQAYPSADFTSSVDGQSVICYPQNLTFTDASTSSSPISNYSWDFGNGTMGTGESTAAAYGKGVYDIKLTVSTSFGCSSDTTRTFELVGPEGDFAMDRNSICPGESINFSVLDQIDVTSYSWDFGDGTTADGTSPIEHIYEVAPPSGQTVAKLILQGEDAACTFVVEKNVFIPNVVADFSVGNSLCVGPVAFTNNSQNSNSYQWTFGDGNSSTAINPTNTFANAGDYTITLVARDAELGCTDEIQQTISLAATTTLEVAGDTICPGTSAQLRVLNATEGSTYSWTPADLISNQVANPTTTPLTQNTTFAVEATDPFGCVGIGEALVFVIMENTVADWDTTIQVGTTISLPIDNGDGIYDFDWNPSTGLSNTQVSNPTVTPLEDITYEVEISDIENCFETNAIFNIVVLPEDLVLLPDAFSPNSDGTNDTFKPLIFQGAEDNVTIERFEIYNRWGQKVYDGNNPTQGWDGKQNNQFSPSDTYVYLLEYRVLSDNELIRLDGEVALLR